MYNIQLPSTIDRIIVIYYGLGLWNVKDKAGFCSTALKMFHFSYFLSFFASIAVKAIVTDDSDEFVFFTALSIIVSVHVIRMFYIIAKKPEILKLIHQIGTHSTTEIEDAIHSEKKIKNFMKFGKGFMFACIVEVSMFIIVPALLNDATIVNIAFPFGNLRSIFWIKQTFLLIGGAYSILSVFLSTTIWFLMVNAAIKYDLLGNQLKNLGVMRKVEQAVEIEPNQITSNKTEQDIFLADLIAIIQSHQKVNQ